MKTKVIALLLLAGAWPSPKLGSLSILALVRPTATHGLQRIWLQLRF